MDILYINCFRNLLVRRLVQKMGLKAGNNLKEPFFLDSVSIILIALV